MIQQQTALLPAINVVFGVVIVLSGEPSFASFTAFEGITMDDSVNGQGVRGFSGDREQEVVNSAGNTAWRVSNAVTPGSPSDKPFSPRDGVAPTDTVDDPVEASHIPEPGVLAILGAGVATLAGKKRKHI